MYWKLDFQLVCKTEINSGVPLMRSRRQFGFGISCEPEAMNDVLMMASQNMNMYRQCTDSLCCVLLPTARLWAGRAGCKWIRLCLYTLTMLPTKVVSANGQMKSSRYVCVCRCICSIPLLDHDSDYLTACWLFFRHFSPFFPSLIKLSESDKPDLVETGERSGELPSLRT